MQLGKICDRLLWHGSTSERMAGMVQDYEKRLNRVVEHIHDNPGGDLSQDRLADVAASRLRRAGLVCSRHWPRY